MAHLSVLFAKMCKTCDWNGIFIRDSISRATIRKSWSAGTIWPADGFLLTSETLVRNWKFAASLQIRLSLILKTITQFKSAFRENLSTTVSIRNRTKDNFPSSDVIVSLL